MSRRVVAARRAATRHPAARRSRPRPTSRRRAVGALALAAALVAAASLIPGAGGVIPRYLASWQRWLFGLHAWAVPVLLALAGLVLLVVERPRLTKRLAGLLVLLLTVLLAEHLPLEPGREMAQGASGHGGGSVGGAQAWLWRRLLGDPGPAVGVALGAVAAFFLVTRLSPLRVIEAVALGVLRAAAAIWRSVPGVARTIGRAAAAAWTWIVGAVVGVASWLWGIVPRHEERRGEQTPAPEFVLCAPELSSEPAAQAPAAQDAPEPKTALARKPRPKVRQQALALEPDAASHGPWTVPPRSILQPSPPGRGRQKLDPQEVGRSLEAVLRSFGVEVKCVGWEQGPVVTRYELQPAPGVKVQRITSLTNDIALALAAQSVRIEAPIPGKSAVGIELPNEKAALVTLHEILDAPEFGHPDPLLVALGKDIAGYPVVANLVEMPHLLIAGATGSGKSVTLNTIIASVLMRATPDQVRFVMIDPKRVELTHYDDIPHLLIPVVRSAKDAAAKLRKIIAGMERRYEVFAAATARNVQAFNALSSEERVRAMEAVSGDKLGEGQDGFLPYVVVVIDELADLMMVAPADFEDSIVRLAQMARATGIHLVVATQRPSVDVITGLIKANIPSRIAFAVSSMVDSRTILDTPGAEKLLGRGDMLYLPTGANRPTRVQGAYVSDQEIERIADFWKDQGRPAYDDSLLQADGQEVGEEGEDELLGQAARIVVQTGYGSVSLLQRKMKIGYVRAARIVDQLEARGIVGPPQGSNPREVLIGLEEVDRLFSATAQTP
ncbi:MAG: DNA translocase FtsK [Armatimonadota bacterium]|nr:DNA translocase FtsK [Armatimonadota bacterium]MDR5697885.1 DNA translocase FtsK [Armatimonadota bacterium]